MKLNQKPRKSVFLGGRKKKEIIDYMWLVTPNNHT